MKKLNGKLVSRQRASEWEVVRNNGSIEVTTGHPQFHPDRPVVPRAIPLQARQAEGVSSWLEQLRLARVNDTKAAVKARQVRQGKGEGLTKDGTPRQRREKRPIVELTPQARAMMEAMGMKVEDLASMGLKGRNQQKGAGEQHKVMKGA